MASNEGLSQEEMIELIKKAQAGSKEAEAKMVEGNIRLIWSVVERYRKSRVPPEDLFQIGAYGLLKAIRNFDFSYNVYFSTYAIPMIRGEIQRFVRDIGTDPLRVPRSIKQLAYRIVKQGLTEHSVEQVCDVLGETDIELVKDTLKYIQTGRTVRSIEQPAYEDKGREIRIIDTLGGGIEEDKWVENIALQQALNVLEERERKVINLRYFKDWTQQDIADEIGVSQAQVSRIESNALLKLRGLMKGDIDMARGDREKAIELLKTTDLTYKEISELTGVPTGSLGVMARKYRSPEVSKRNKTRGGRIASERLKGKKEQKAETKLETEVPVMEEQVVVNKDEEQLTQLVSVSKESEESLSFEISVSLKGQKIKKDEAVSSIKKVVDILKMAPTETVSFDVKIRN